VLVVLLELTGSGLGGYGSFLAQQVTAYLDPLMVSAPFTNLLEVCKGLPVFSNFLNEAISIAVYVLVPFPASFEFCEDFLIAALPCVIMFGDLHLTEKIKEARAALKGKSGIYCFTCTTTGGQYIGSALDLYDRLYDHLMDHSSNVYLQNAIAKYGLNCFVFQVVELSDPEDLLVREQYWLDWLFSAQLKD